MCPTGSRGSSTPPRTVFAIERALGAPPGELSRYFGYFPVDSPEVHASAVEAAVLTDPLLSLEFRRALIALYREAVKSVLEGPT
jgi:hypothetical protein